MAERSEGGAVPWLALLIGGLLVAVAVIAFVVYSGGGKLASQAPRSVDVNLNVPKAPSLPDAPKLPDAPVPTPK